MPKNFDRRAFLEYSLKTGAGFTVLGGAGALLEACGGSGGGKPVGANTHEIAKAGIGDIHKAKMGGSATIGVEAEEAGMDPSEAHFDSTGVMYARAVYDPLTSIRKDGTVVPYLAESVTPNKNYTTWTITARKGIEFHDGTPLDGDALYYNMNAFHESPLVNFALTYFKKGGIKKVSQYAVSIDMEAPWVPFPAWMAGYIGGQLGYMFSPAQMKKSEKTLNIHPVGTGPFVYSQWVPGDHFTLTKNPHYWRRDALGRQLPYLDSWTFKPIIDAESRYEALTAGTIDIMHTDDDTIIESIRSNSSIAYIEDDKLTIGEPDCNFAMINTQDPIMKDIRLRQAMAYAYNAKQYIADVGKNIVEKITGPFPEPSPWAGSSQPNFPQYDPAKATALVQSWMKDNGGKKPSVKYSTTNSTEALQDTTIAASYMQAVGFEVQVNGVEQSAYIDDAVLGQYQIFGWRQFANVDPDLNYIFWSEVTTKPPFVINFARNIDPKIQSALDKARQSTDPTLRKEQYDILADRLAVDLPYIWSNRDVWNVAASKQLQNWNNPTGAVHEDLIPMLSGIIWPCEIWKD